MKYIWTSFVLLSIFSCSEDLPIETSTQIDTASLAPAFIIGEEIDGLANIRDKPNGKILFTLKDGVKVETTPTVENWLDVGLYVDLSPEQIKHCKIPPGSMLFKDKVNIGQTLDTIYTWLDNGEQGYISGFSYVKNIKVNSYPENYLSHLLAQDDNSFIAYKDFMKHYKFEKYAAGNLPDLTEYFIYESMVVDPSPRDRITLLFKADNLIGVVHNRALQTKFKTYDLIRGHKLTFVSGLPEADIKRVIDRKIEFYNSVD